MSEIKQAADDIAGTIGAAIDEHGSSIDAIASGLRTSDDRDLTLADTIDTISSRMTSIRDAICRPGVPWDDGLGGKVGDLTEATIYAGQGLHAIAAAIGELAEAIREHGVAE